MHLFLMYLGNVVGKLSNITIIDNEYITGQVIGKTAILKFEFKSVDDKYYHVERKEYFLEYRESM